MAFCASKSFARAAAPVCLLLLVSCTEQLPVGGALSDIGVLEGRITEAGVPVPAKISFFGASESPYSSEFAIQADSTGWYRAEMPLGRYSYSLSVDGVSGPWYSWQDTVTVGRAVRRWDLARGRARISLGLPSAFDQQAIGLRVDAPWVTSSHQTTAVAEAASFDLRLMKPADYTMKLNPDVTGESLYLPDNGNPTAAQTMRVGTDAVVEYAFDFRGRHASLTGRVISSPLLRGQDMRVEVMIGTDIRRALVTCGDDGAFRLDLLAPEPVRLRADHQDVERWFGGDSFSTATVYDLSPGVHLTDANLSSGGLRVRFEGPGDLVDNAGSMLILDDAGVEHLVPNTTSNPIVVENLRPGPIRLRVLGGCEGQPWLSQWYDGQATPEEATTPDIVAGQLTDVVVTLAGGGAISGTLAFNDDNPPWSVPASVHDTDGHRLCPGNVRFWGHSFSFRGLSDGEYLLAIYLGSTPWWYPGTWELVDAEPASIVDGGTVTGLVWRLPFPYGKASP